MFAQDIRNAWKCWVIYVTTNGTTSLEAFGLVCNALVREILAARGNCFLGNYYYNHEQGDML